MSSDNKKIFTTQAVSKGSGVDVTSDVIALPDSVSDAILSVKTDASCTGVVDVKLEMSPDGTNWCPAVTRTVAANVVSIEPKIGNEEYVKLTPDAGEFKNKHARGGLNFDVNGAVVTPDGSGARDLMDQHIAVNKSFNYSQWFKTSEAPTTTYKPVLFRHGGYDDFENTKVIQTDGTSNTQNLCDQKGQVPLTYRAGINATSSGTVSEWTTDKSANDFRYATNPARNWTTVAFHPTLAVTGSNSNNFSPAISTVNPAITHRYYGPYANGYYSSDRLYVYPFSGYISSSDPDYAIIGNFYNAGGYIQYMTGANYTKFNTQAMMSILVNSFNVSTLTQTLTFYFYSIDGTLLANPTYNKTFTQDQYDFFNGTHATRNFVDNGLSSNTTYAGLAWGGWATSKQVFNTAYSSANISNLFTTNADGSLSFKDASTNSNCIAQFRMGNGANDNTSSTPYVLTNEAPAITTFPAQVTAYWSDLLSNSPTAYAGLTELKPVSNDLFSASSNLSISGWFKTTNTGTLFSNTEGAAANGMKFDIGTTYSTLGFLDSAQVVSLQSASLNTGNWKHLVVTKSSGATPTVKVYVDGDLYVTNTLTATTDSDFKGSNGFTLLGDGQNNANASNPAATDSSKLNASLSNWSIHSEVLDEFAVKQLYSNGHVRNIKNLPNVDANAIEAWWQLNDQTTPEQDLSVNGNDLQYQDGVGAPLTAIQVNADGATLVEDTINGNAMTLSLTKSFNFTTKKWVTTADQPAALCLSLNGFEEQAEHIALWKCAQTVGGKSIDICDGEWHNVILSYRGNNDLAGDDVAEGDVVKFGPGPAQNLPHNWMMSFDGEPLKAINDGSGADHIDGLGSTVTDTYNSTVYNVGFNVYNRHMKYEASNTEEVYKPHAQFSAGIHEVTGVDNINAFQGSVDETSFHSDCWWVDQAGTSIIQNTFNQEKPATIYGSTTALADRGAGTAYPVGVPYPLLNPEEIGSSRGGNQWINPYRKGEVQEDAATSIGGVEGWWRWGDTPGDCSVTINDVRDHDDSINARDIAAFEIVTSDRQDMSVTPESIYNEDIASGSATGNVAITFPQIVVAGIQAGICNLKQISSPLLKYLRVKFTGAGSCDLGSSSTQAQINFRSKE